MASPSQQPDQDPTIHLTAFSGMKNTVSRETLTPDELEAAINIDIDDKGKLHRRRGQTWVSSGTFHSLFNADDWTLIGVRNGTLGVINPDYSFQPIAYMIGDQIISGGRGGPDPTAPPFEDTNPIVYRQVGSTIYFTSATNSGKIDTRSWTATSWGPDQDIWLSPVVNPTPTLTQVRGKRLGKPPLATSIAYYNGRLYLGSGRTVWATELFLYDYVDKTRTFWQFEGDITMIGDVADGVYVGTTEGVWFLSGPTFAETKRVRVLDSAVIPGSMVFIPAELANPPQIGTQADTPLEVSLGFMTINGFCVAEDGGKTYNLTESKFRFPTAQRAAALYRVQDGVNQYIVVSDSEGTPVNNARIGDFVDGEIVKGNNLWPVTSDRVMFRDTFIADVV